MTATLDFNDSVSGAHKKKTTDTAPRRKEKTTDTTPQKKEEDDTDSTPQQVKINSLLNFIYICLYLSPG